MQRGQTRFLRAETPFIFKSARLDPGWPNFDALPHRECLTLSPWALPSPSKGEREVRLERGADPARLAGFHREVLGAIHLVQLLGIALGGGEPVGEALLHARIRRGRQRIEVGLDREVIAHRVALRGAEHSAAVDRPALAILADDGESDLVPAGGGEISPHWEGPHPAGSATTLKGKGR